jgi:hypothetical protein
MENISVKLAEDGRLIIRIKLAKNPPPSTSGKNLVLASTRGNMATEIKINGKTLILGLNAYIKA